MVHAFRKGIVSGPFNVSLIQNHPKTFAEIKRHVMAHIAAEEEVGEKRTCVVPTRPRATGHHQTLRVHEAMTEMKTPMKQQPYQPRKPNTRGRGRDNVPPRHDFVVELNELIAIPNIVERLKVPPKTDKRLGPNKNAWCEFHQAFGHPIRNFLALEHQLDELVKNGLLRDYLQEKQGTEDSTATGGGPGHEVPVHGEVHTITREFSGGGCTASQRRRYARTMMSVEAHRTNDAFDVELVFTKADLEDVVPRDNDPVVISAVTAGRKVHRVLVDQGSSADVMFWMTFNKLQLSPDMLRPYGGCLYGFVGDQVEVRRYLELGTTFTNGTASRTESIRYLVVKVFSAYNMLLGRPTLNRLGAIPSTRHMKMKLPDLTGKVITIKSYQKKAKRCYENNLKTRRGVSMVTNGLPYTEEVHLPKVSRSKPDETVAEIARRTKSDSFGNSGKRETGEKVSNLSNIPGQTGQTPVEKILESRTGVPSDDRLGDRLGPQTET
ncbi:uncharacterized protein [Phaseolus vulgaris]|uniref:uncharacterized protein n=1 Tax=Phaseolus vulgaris TaxID=3885 RepID=UPI0035CBD186